MLLLLLVLRSGGSTAAAEGISAGCADLVVDCGAVPDDATDSAAAFYRCMALASQRSGCVTIPGGSYRISPVQFNQSNLEFTVANRAVFRPHRDSESSTGGGALFTFGEHAPTSANYITNVSLHGLAPGRFIVDVSEPLRKPWRVRAVAFAGINGFALANVLAKMSPPDSRSEPPDGDGRSQWYDLPTRFLPPTSAFAAFPDQRLNSILRVHTVLPSRLTTRSSRTVRASSASTHKVAWFQTSRRQVPSQATAWFSLGVARISASRTCGAREE